MPERSKIYTFSIDVDQKSVTGILGPKAMLTPKDDSDLRILKGDGVIMQIKLHKTFDPIIVYVVCKNVDYSH